MNRQSGGGVAAKVVTLGLVVALTTLLARMDASVAGRDAAFNSFACPGSTRRVHCLSRWRNCARTRSATRAAW